MGKQRSKAIAPVRQVAGYRRGPRTPEDLRRIRAALVAGPAGGKLGLDIVPGVVWVRIVDHGARGVFMPPAQAFVEVWGGNRDLVFASVARNRPPGVEVVVRWYGPSLGARLKRWGVFAVWRLRDVVRGLRGR